MNPLRWLNVLLMRAVPGTPVVTVGIPITARVLRATALDAVSLQPTSITARNTRPLEVP